MERMRETSMETGGESLFNHDPFLSLDNDLDDVSEVIRNNLFGDQPNLFDMTSRTPSPQYYRDTNIFASHMDADLVFKSQSNFSVPSSNANKSDDREIGEIALMLQDNHQLLASPDPSTSPPHQMDHNLVQIKPEYSMDTSTNEVYDIPQPMGQYASTSTIPLDYHQMSPRKPSQFNSHYNQFEQIPSQQPAYPNQYMYELPRASSSSAIHGMLCGNAIQQVVGDEMPLIRPLSDQNLYSYSNASPMPTGVHFGQDTSSSSDDNTKQELIKMLLEMKPGELERLRHQKAKKIVGSPKPLNPARKRCSLQLNTSPQLLVSVGSSPSLESTGKQPVYTPELISPQSSTGPWREDDSEDELLSNSIITPITARKGPKTERRTAHNLIEKKYRCSINDRINHLKELLAPEETKLSKSATLRKAIDHILHLRENNTQLVRENEMLKKRIKSLGAEVPLMVNNNKYSKPNSTAISIPDESSESPGSQSSNSSSPHIITKKSGQMLNQSRVSLCTFMFMVLMLNPFALLLGPSEATGPTNNIIGRIPVQHRTLKSFDNDYTFDEGPNDWWHRAFTRHALIWLINLFIVFLILTRLLVYGEPVTDRRSPTWITFLKCKKQANDAINACNYKEAQRQLGDALFILGRALPRPGGLEELMSVAWQVIRHILNGLWIGRWFSRRKRSKSMPAPAVCRSHASTALVYHQLNQLHLLGIDALESSRLTGLNLALSAVNLAESAGISRDGVTHRLRADIYIHAALCTKLCLPRFFARLVCAYFLQRARRHVQKSSSVDGIEMYRYRWIFHPLSHNFLADTNVINEILVNSRQMAHFPFSQPYTSPKPIDRLTSAFKMHLLALLMNQLNSISSNLRMVDFVDLSHLLLSICTSELQQSGTLIEEEKQPKDEAADWEASTKGQSDELCMWWSNLISCGLYWKFSDHSRAQKHYALIRKCPKPLLNCNLALAVGLAFCARKICMEDKNKKEFVNMLWFHVRESFVHIRKEEPLNPRKTSSMAIAMNQLIRSLTFDWLLNSMLDVWRLNLNTKYPFWEQPAPSQMKQLYREVLADYGHSGIQSTDRIKVLIFKVMFRLLDGANPITTWRLLSRHCSELVADNDEASSSISAPQFELIKRLREDIKLASSIKVVD